jgi:hypothetical protein
MGEKKVCGVAGDGRTDRAEFHPYSNGCRCCLARQQRVTPAEFRSASRSLPSRCLSTGEGRCSLDIAHIMESSPYDAPAGDQLMDSCLFQLLHPTLPKRYGTNSLLWEFERTQFGYRSRSGISASLRTEEAMIGGAVLAFWALVATGLGSDGLPSPVFFSFKYFFLSQNCHPASFSCLSSFHNVRNKLQPL